METKKYPLTFQLGMEDHQDRAVLPMGAYKNEKVAFLPKSEVVSIVETQESYVIVFK